MILTDKDIKRIATKYTESRVTPTEHGHPIPPVNISDFARAIEDFIEFRRLCEDAKPLFSSIDFAAFKAHDNLEDALMHKDACEWALRLRKNVKNLPESVKRQLEEVAIKDINVGWQLRKHVKDLPFGLKARITTKALKDVRTSFLLRVWGKNLSDNEKILLEGVINKDPVYAFMFANGDIIRKFTT